MGTGRDAGDARTHRPGRAAAGVLGGAVPWGGAVARPGFLPGALWPGWLLGRLRHRLLADARAEAASGRLILWLPVLFGAGILLYFGAAQEPSLAAACGLTVALAVGTVLARAQPVTFAVLLALLALAGGFAVACVHTAWVDHPILLPPAGAVRLVGHVEQVERRPKADRILLRVSAAEARGLAYTPSLVRLSLGRGYAPAAGMQISVLTRLLPPMEPAMPGGYDFGRGPWFQGIEAVGFGLGRPKIVTTPAAPPLSVRIGTAIEQVRLGIGGRIRQSLSGSQADIAIALVVGDRASISPAIEESMRVSGLTHVLSISGLHMAMVAGTLFALVRGLLAAVPSLALGFPIKTTAALVALTGCAGYLILSGNDWPAQRSFYMLAIVLLGVMVGRAALNLRTVAVAATVVLVLGPQAILEAGTQMSFAATLALVAVFQGLRGLWSHAPKGSVAGQMLMRGALFVAALSLTSLVAGAATAPYAALHFQRLGTYGLLSNLAAMPAVEFLVMPFGLAGVLLMPFGWDFLAWPVMGWGIEIMVRVSDFVAALPGADARTDMVGPAAAGAATLMLLCLCLLRGMLTLVAVVPALAFVLLLGAPQRPDVLIAPNAQTVAIRGTDGRLSVIGAKSSRLVVEQWLSREGDIRKADAKDLSGGFRCDASGCTARLPDGALLAVSHGPESLEADCLAAAIVVTPFTPPLGCRARAFVPRDMARTGTLVLYRKPAAGEGQRNDFVSVPNDGHGSGSGASPRGQGGGLAPAQPSPLPSAKRPALAVGQRSPSPGAEPAPSLQGPATSGAAYEEDTGAEQDGIIGDPAIIPRMRPRRMAADQRASLRRQAAKDRAEASGVGAIPVAPERSPASSPSNKLRTADLLSRAKPALSQEAAPQMVVPPQTGPLVTRPQPPPVTPATRLPPPSAQETFASHWRVVPTRLAGVQRPWMPVLPALPEPSEAADVSTERAAEDAAAEP